MITRKLFNVVVVSLLSIASICSAVEGTWTTKADMPTARLGLTTSTVNGKIYAIGGGATIDGTAFRTVVEYDPSTDTWTRKADMPTQRYFHSACVVNGKVYIIGGAVATKVTTPTVEEYDPATDTWTTKADMPTARCFLSASVANDKIYAIGGQIFPGNFSVSTVEEYDPATNTWTTKTDMPTDRSMLCASAVDGRIYAMGGVQGWIGNAGLSTVEAYDPVTDTWTKMADMPTPRKGLSTLVMAEKIVAIGGCPSGNGPGLSKVEAYDPQTDSWAIKPDMPTARWFLSTSSVNGKIYAIGGSLQDTHDALSTVKIVEEYALTPPSPDFNGDGIVDAKDMCIMVDHWLTEDPLCDIAPMPFGDGIVDVLDLILLSEHLFEEILPPGLVAYWKLDETEGDIAYDSAGENFGTLSGNPVWQPDSGQVVGALQFDGLDDYISTAKVLNPKFVEFSVFAWIKGGSPGQVIISQKNSFGGISATWLGIDPVNGCLMTELVSPPVGRFIAEPLESSHIVTNDIWHHIGIVWDGSYRILYVDGMEVAKDTDPLTSLNNSDGGLYIGVNKNRDAGTFFSGLIDDVRIYDKALTAEEIAALAQ